MMVVGLRLSEEDQMFALTVTIWTEGQATNQ